MPRKKTAIEKVVAADDQKVEKILSAEPAKITFSLDAERALLGSMILQGELIQKLEDKLKE